MRMFSILGRLATPLLAVVGATAIATATATATVSASNSVAVSSSSTSSSSPSPSPITLDQSTLRMVDSYGREKIFHGTNSIVKGPPWHPDYETFSSDISMAGRDFDIMNDLGLNLLRLGVMWPGLEPSPGAYNETYLDQLYAIVDLAWEHGVYTLLDMHQDGLSEYFCGEGIPPWAVRHTAKFNANRGAFPAPFDSLNSTDYYCDPAFNGSPELPSRNACASKNLGPGHSETTMAAADAYQALYTNVDGMLDAWAAAWTHVASRFNGHPGVLGIELLNEPFAGDMYHHPLLMVPKPNPHNADAVNLQPAYKVITEAVRKVNEEVLIFFAGVTWGDLGAGFTAAPDPKSILAFHYYSAPQFNVPLQFEAQARSGKSLGVGTFLTETSQPGPGQTGFDEVGGIGDGADAALVGWAGFEWKSFCRDQDSGPDADADSGAGPDADPDSSTASPASPSQLGQFGACKTGYSSNWDSDVPSEEFQSANARSYATAVAGHAVSMFYNVSNCDFELVYDSTDITTDENPTEIYVWGAGHYPSGLLITASASTSKGTVAVPAVWDGVSQVKVIASGLEEGTRISVRVSAV